MHVINASGPQDAREGRFAESAACNPASWHPRHRRPTTASGTVRRHHGSIYDGELAADRCRERTTAEVHDPHGRAASRSASGITTSRVAGVAIEDLRIYDRADHRHRRPAGDATGQIAPRTVDILAKPAREAHAAREVEELFAMVAGVCRTRNTRTLALPALSASCKSEEVAIRGRGTIAHVMNEKPGEPTARSCCSAATTTSAGIP